MSLPARPKVGIVVIGRNEGERLNQCLQSVIDFGPVVYVDSGSTDGSTELARSKGVEVIDLDLSVPFTAARARNAGWKRLIELYPTVSRIQFVDGDCEVDPQWFAAAEQAMSRHVPLAVCGRRRERFAELSIYNRLCDLEWDTPVGEAESCGGDALFHVTAFELVGGFRDSMIAGEEPELCFRLRKRGAKILRIDSDMTYHDAALTRFRQWWTRAVRAGHAYAEGAWLTRDETIGLWRREVRSTWFWGAIVPLMAIVPAPFTYGWSLFLLLAYVVLWFRIRIRAAKRWPRSANLYATFCVIAKCAHLVGMLRFHRNRRSGKGSRIIEYKSPAPLASRAL